MSVLVTDSLSPGCPAGLADPALHGELKRFLGRRLGETDVDDAVQSTLAEALASPNLPADPEGLRRFVFGIARHKLADHFRRRRRESGDDGADDVAAPSGDSVGVRDLMRWAERELPPEGEAQRTFEWMLREGDGEKLERIAEEERIPAPRVRQRVSRLRRYLRARWVAQAALAGITTGVIALVVYLAALDRAPAPQIAEELPRPNPELERARALRERALRDCAERELERCLEGLDRARALDPAGDGDQRVQEARAAASAARAPAPPAIPAPSSRAPEEAAPESAPEPSPKSTPAPKKPRAPVQSKKTEDVPPLPRQGNANGIGDFGGDPKK